MKTIFLTPWLLLASLAFAKAEPFAFQDGDTVIFLGNTFIERAQQNGYIERELTMAAGDKKVRFRNLGWSGDTVHCDARSYFGPPQEGFDRLTKMIEELKPNVIFICYGGVEAFEGKDGMESFTSGYNKLLTMIYEKAAPRETVLISPPPAENLGGLLPNQTGYNEKIALYRDAIKGIAAPKNAKVLDLFAALGSGQAKDRKWTDNGIHYTPEGYAAIAPIFVKQLGLTPYDASLVKNPENYEKLRQTIIEKDRLYFYRWRPANETYLNLFRKHEQGQNARELPLYEPLVEAQELNIMVLKNYLLGK